MATLQLSLFPKAESFDSNNFDKFVDAISLNVPISKSLAMGFRKTMEYSIGKSKRTQANNLHEEVFIHLEKELRMLFPDLEMVFADINSGNERLFFQIGDYIFILRLDGASKNNTKVSDMIVNQYASKHIIILEYRLSELRDKILSFSFIYEMGNVVMYERHFTLQNISIDLPLENNPVEIIPELPKLRVAVKETN